MAPGQFLESERAVSSHHLEYLFSPRSLAVIGASDRAGSIGATVMRNVLAGGFRGPVWPVNLHHRQVAGVHAYATPAQLPATPDLAVICTPAPTIPGLIAALGARGTRAAVVLSAGLDAPAEHGGTLAAAMLAAARRHALRILGPNCIGLIVPGAGLNASFAHLGAHAGGIAFVAQSGALISAMLDWAHATGVGFSHCISLGNAADVDFGDLLDYLARDARTRAILLYIESLSSARKFMSAARAAARNKPVIAVKAGRTGEAARAATSHSGALAGADAVYEAALRRAGVLRVATTRQLFEAAQILSQYRTYVGPRLAIISNGGGPAVMATDALIEGGGELARLSAETLAALDRLLPGGWSRDDPVDIVGDAPPARYHGALSAVLEDPQVDAVLLVHAPTAVATTTEVARVCTPLLEKAARPAFACWLGAEGVKLAGAAGPRAVPGYATPEEAVEAYLQVMRYHQVQELLMQAPTAGPEGPPPDVAAARCIITAALAAGRAVLNEPESKALLAAYHIPVVETRIAADIAALGPIAAEIGYPVALKILSRDISHKSDVGGVALNLGTFQELTQAATAMLQRCQELRPQARIEGFTVQRMLRRGGAQELFAGIALDPTFGPVVLFGRGGTAVEVIGDRALALPPLNSVLTRDLIARTRVARLLAGARGVTPVSMPALETALMRLAQLACDVAEVVELDINPLLADRQGVIALDARVRLAPSSASAVARLAIRPYPRELEETVECCGRRLLLRPIRPEDAARHRQFLAQVTPQDLYLRFFSGVRELPAADLAHLTQLDYDREMAFVAVATDAAGVEEIVGVSRASCDPDNSAAEFAVLVRSDLKGQGLGKVLMRKLIGYCRARGTRELWGNVLAENTAMLHLASSLGFRVRGIEQNIETIALELQPPERS
ncbi:MAG TPA: bifunctional acetate--CoA ligase family protein/GNAT family N-acetyltransferase [Steroidobacteraceae bacterium]|nr:bifunctional acetate--CoA ligase family protein/GNAT family N-acetyltransferase [Steroidobacteraceae bacterium]